MLATVPSSFALGVMGLLCLLAGMAIHRTFVRLRQGE